MPSWQRKVAGLGLLVLGVAGLTLLSEALFGIGQRLLIPAGVRGDADLISMARPLLADRDSWHLPPIDTLFVQRKISGTALLAARLKARVDIRALTAVHDRTPGIDLSGSEAKESR